MQRQQRDQTQAFVGYQGVIIAQSHFGVVAP